MFSSQAQHFLFHLTNTEPLSMFSEGEFTENDLCSAVHAAKSRSNKIESFSFLLKKLQILVHQK